jgi:hypothetical protein
MYCSDISIQLLELRLSWIRDEGGRQDAKAEDSSRSGPPWPCPPLPAAEHLIYAERGMDDRLHPDLKKT